MSNNDIINAFINGDFDGECVLINTLKDEQEKLQKLEHYINMFSFLLDISPSKKITLINEDINTSYEISDLLDEKTYQFLYRHVLSKILVLLDFSDEEYDRLEEEIFGKNYFERGDK